MQEMIVTKIDADMGKGTTHGVEENQVTRFKLACIDLLTNFAHFARCTRQRSAYAVFKDKSYKTTAIQAAIFVIAAETIANTDQFQALQDDILCCIGVPLEERKLRFFGFFKLLGGAHRTNLAAKDCGRKKESS